MCCDSEQGEGRGEGLHHERMVNKSCILKDFFSILFLFCFLVIVFCLLSKRHWSILFYLCQQLTQIYRYVVPPLNIIINDACTTISFSLFLSDLLSSSRICRVQKFRSRSARCLGLWVCLALLPASMVEMHLLLETFLPRCF